MPSIEVPRSATHYGFRVEPTGTLLSRTIMLADLRALLRTCPSCSDREAYRSAVVEENVLGKPTAAARSKAFERLRELYALDPRILLFRAIRDLWDAEDAAQPMLALLCATARDPILRAITPYLLRLPVGTEVATNDIADEAERQFPDKFVPPSRARLGRNAASSWQKAGLLAGRSTKLRTRPEAQTASLTYALLLGDLCGRRGQTLFTTLWASMLDAPMHEMKELAILASQQGWIEYRAAGDVVEVTFRHLMRDEAVPSR